MTVRATRDSTSVNPREWLFGRGVERNNLSPSREPIDANLIADVSAPQLDGPSAGHAAGEKVDRRAGATAIACLGEQRVERDVARQLNASSARARAYDARSRVERSCDLRPTPDGRGAIGGQQRSDLERVSFKPRVGGRTRYGGENKDGEQGKDSENANDPAERKSRG